MEGFGRRGERNPDRDNPLPDWVSVSFRKHSERVPNYKLGRGVESRQEVFPERLSHDQIETVPPLHQAALHNDITPQQPLPDWHQNAPKSANETLPATCQLLVTKRYRNIGPETLRKRGLPAPPNFSAISSPDEPRLVL